MTKTRHRVLHGTPVSPGIGSGPVLVYDTRTRSVQRIPIPPSRVEAEVDRFDTAVERTREQLRRTRLMVSSKIDKAHAAIFEAQEVLLDDPLLIETCRRDIATQKLNAEFVLDSTVKQIRQLLEQIDTPHLSMHDLDVLDVASRIADNLRSERVVRIDQIARDVLIVAHSLLPSETARLNRRHVLGIVAEVGGPASHFAILAKALKIPAVVGIEGILDQVSRDDPVIVDGFTGAVTIQPTRGDMERLRQRRRRLKADQTSLEKLRDLPCETSDGYPIDLAANLEFPSEVPAVKSSGAHGIGLFRTEFFYIDRGHLPSEDEQFQVYRDVIEQMAPDPVIYRTLDLGGDKFLSKPGVGELNPFLGMRAIRLCLANPDIFRSQLRAMLRASAFGNAKIMFPLISDVTEVQRAIELLKEVQAELLRDGIEYDQKMHVGIMIETPSAALISDNLAQYVDFFSLGTNDLIQYTMAVDRVNESVADLYDPLHPSVLQLIRKTIDSAHRAGICVGVCGEMAADPAQAVLLMGLGVDGLSMSAVAIPEVKRLIRSLTLEDVRKMRQDALSHMNDGQVHTALKRFRRKHLKRSHALA